MRSSKNTLGAPALGFQYRRWVPLSWLEHQRNLEECCKKPRLYLWKVCRCWETGQRELYTGSCCLAALPNPRGINTATLLIPYLSSAEDLGQASLRRFSLAMQRQPRGRGDGVGVGGPGRQLPSWSVLTQVALGTSTPQSLLPAKQTLQSRPFHSTACYWIWDKQFLDEDYHRDSPGLWR